MFRPSINWGIRSMKTITVRRISQVLFFILFIWFCLVATLGERWWQLRGWPVNWLLQLDPLVGLGTLLATHRLYQGLIWGLLTIALTLVLGRVFCGWICPLGALQQWVGYLGRRGLTTNHQVRRNRPHPAQRIKYLLLVFLLAAAAADFIDYVLDSIRVDPVVAGILTIHVVVGVVLALRMGRWRTAWKKTATVLLVLLLMVLLHDALPITAWLAASLQTGLLDPIPLMQRSVNLVFLPLVDNPVGVFSHAPRVYQGAGLIGVLFLVVLMAGLRIPRFYCRFVCPTGALLGLLSRWSVWRIVKGEDRCRNCRQCEAHCEGACAPTETIAHHECVVCFNCVDHCRHDLMGFGSGLSATESLRSPDLKRRHVVITAATGLAAIPMLRLAGLTGRSWNPALVRPPGALDESRFLQHCIKCGQCMRVCPTQVIHPTFLEAGVEGLWTPTLNFRTGTSGCQASCVACSRICPTAAIRPLTVDERMGRNAYQDAGPLRIGMAFVDRGRCLPWAMDTPCIVCQENCPVSPKAIFTRETYQPLRNGRLKVLRSDRQSIVLDVDLLSPGQWSGGDYYWRWNQPTYQRIADNTRDRILVSSSAHVSTLPLTGEFIQVAIRLQQPFVDPRACIGCGICEHECPVQGKRAIRVSAENESRHLEHRLILS
jgi:polyferredoxin